jgi:hypothetical protein
MLVLRAYYRYASKQDAAAAAAAAEVPESPEEVVFPNFCHGLGLECWCLADETEKPVAAYRVEGGSWRELHREWKPTPPELGLIS